MSLVPDYDSSSDSTSDEESEEQITSPPEHAQPKQKLPAPDFNGTSLTLENQEAAQNSVFKNPFKEEENAKEAILQRHVKMVDVIDSTVVINGKKICWNYRKGRCRFGHNCKFAHDSDIQKTKEQLQEEKEKWIKQSVVCQNEGLSQQSQKIPENKPDIEKQQKRKRPGLTQGLIPGKKVMKKYRNEKT